MTCYICFFSFDTFDFSIQHLATYFNVVREANNIQDWGYVQTL